MAETWVLVAIGALLSVHLVLVALAVHRARSQMMRWADTGVMSGTAESSEGGSKSHDDGTVRCPNCGTTNESTYRYCRTCVGELPTGVSLQAGGSRAGTRGRI